MDIILSRIPICFFSHRGSRHDEAHLAVEYSAWAFWGPDFTPNNCSI